MLIVKLKGVIDHNCKSLYSLIDRLIFKYDEEQAKKKVHGDHWLQLGIWMQALLLKGKRRDLKKNIETII